MNLFKQLNKSTSNYYTMTVLLNYIDRSLGFSLILLPVLIFALHFLVMLALCLILSITHYAQTYAGINVVPARNSYIFCLNYPAILFIIGIAS